MSETPFFTGLGPERVNPERLRLLLQESGWTVAGQRTGAYVRLSPPQEGESSVLVPMDRAAPEYSRSMRAALADIRRLASGDTWAANVAARLVVEPSDNFRFRAETAAPSGLISWPQGEQLISSSRRILAAGAKTYVQHLKYFGNRFGQFANRYLAMVLMGQTAPGSYIVTAFTPANAFVQISGGQSAETRLFNLPEEIASTRAVGVSIMSAAAASREAVDHYRSNGSLAAFEELVTRGVSYEMTTALGQLIEGSDGADISVEWDPALEPPRDAPASHVEFAASDVEVLTRASTELAVTEPTTLITVMGRVHLLTRREAGGPGVIGIENLSSTRPKKLRVHLSDRDYHLALRAHDQNEAVVVEGRMEREGNIFWVYDGRLISVLGPLDEMAKELRERPVQDDPNQLELDIGDDE
jgi:hypothetical protein